MFNGRVKGFVISSRIPRFSFRGKLCVVLCRISGNRWGRGGCLYFISLRIVDKHDTCVRCIPGFAFHPSPYPQTRTGWIMAGENSREISSTIQRRELLYDLEGARKVRFLGCVDSLAVITRRLFLENNRLCPGYPAVRIHDLGTDIHFIALELVSRRIQDVLF